MHAGFCYHCETVALHEAGHNPVVFEEEWKAMKKGIHPEYNEAIVRCVCGNEFRTRSTLKEIDVEICSNCHPFFTGQQKLVDSAGRVERFMKKYGLRPGEASETAMRKTETPPAASVDPVEEKSAAADESKPEAAAAGADKKAVDNAAPDSATDGGARGNKPGGGPSGAPAEEQPDADAKDEA